MTTPTSPTLTMKVRAPEALAAFRALRVEADALKASLAGLHTTGSAGGRTRQQAEIRELRAALAATRVEVEQLALAKERAAVRSSASATKEVTTARQKAAAVKAAAAEEQVAAEKAAAYKHQVMLRSAQMTARTQLAANAAVEASLAAHLVKQEAMREAALNRQFRQLQAAHARNESLNAAARARNLREQAAAAAAGGSAGAVAAGGASAAATGIGRSAARGAAGASGALWLTYGQSIPALLGGYAAASGVKASIQRGSEFQYQTAFAGALGEMDADSIARMRQELMKLGTDSIYGPIELAKAMRVLQQAGVDAADSLQILPISMKVALQGEVDLTKASETLVGVMRQYHLEVKDIEKIGDAISKTAAVTQANIPTLMEGLKAAVGVAQYGVDLNQSLANIGALAKQGIVGSSGGTFFRRFVEDIYMPKSLGARRAMEELQFTPYNKDGSRRDYREVQEELFTKLQKLDPESQIKLLGEMMDIRALKNANVHINDMANSFKTLRAEIDASSGQLDVFWKALSGETKNLWAQVKSNFEGLFVGGFDQVQSPLNGFLRDLRDFAKDESAAFVLKALLAIPEGWIKLATTGGRVFSGPSMPENILRNQDEIDRLKRAGADSSKPNQGFMNFDNDTLRGLEADQRGLMYDYYQSPAYRAQALTRVDPEVERLRGFVRGRTGALNDGVGAVTTPRGRASQRVLDPLEHQRQQQMADAMEREAMASMNRRRAEINQTASHEQRLVEEKHRAGLIGETEYVAAIDRLNAQRAQSAIEAANEELQVLHDTRLIQATEQEKVASDTRIRNLQAQRDRLLDEAKYQKDLVEVQRAGAKKRIEDDTSKMLEKHRRDEEMRVEQRNMARDLRLASAEDAAQMQAEFAARKRMESDLLTVDSEIAKQGGPGPALEALKERRRLILDLRDAYIEMQGAEARADAALQRSWGYGQEDAFRSYVDAATNAAQQARDAWTSAFTSVENALTELMMTGKASWRDYANVIIQELIRIQIRKAMAGVINQFLPSFGVTTGIAGGSTSIFGGVSSATAHGGGIVGELLQSRIVPASVFANAPRFHAGGIIGDEQPIIAKHGEGVFTEQQMKRLSPTGGGRFTVNVRNETGVAVQAEASQPRFDGEEIVMDLFLRRLQRDAGARESVSTLLRAPQ